MFVTLRIAIFEFDELYLDAFGLSSLALVPNSHSIHSAVTILI